MRPKTSLHVSNTHNSAAIFRAPNTITLIGHSSFEFEIPSPTYIKIITELNELEEIDLQFCCYSRLELPPPAAHLSNKRRYVKSCRVWRLNIIIYGTVALEDTVGRHLSKHRAYLQDPVDCERNVLYRNPHMISNSGNIVTTDSFATRETRVEIERLNVGPDLLAQLMAEQTTLEETEPPSIVTTPLFR